MSHSTSAVRNPATARVLDDSYSRSVSEALRQGIAARLRSPVGSSPELREALRMACDEAKNRGLRAEQLIVMFRQTWNSLPEVQTLPPGPRRSDVLAEVITLCLASLYSAD